MKNLIKLRITDRVDFLSGTDENYKLWGRCTYPRVKSKKEACKNLGHAIRLKIHI